MWLEIDLRVPDLSCDPRSLLFSRPDSRNSEREKRKKAGVRGQLGWGMSGYDFLTGNAASLPQAFGTRAQNRWLFFSWMKDYSKGFL